MTDDTDLIVIGTEETIASLGTSRLKKPMSGTLRLRSLNHLTMDERPKSSDDQFAKIVICQSRKSEEISHHQEQDLTSSLEPWFEMIGTARQFVLAQPNVVMEPYMQTHDAHTTTLMIVEAARAHSMQRKKEK
jgi:hypothetical protein